MRFEQRCLITSDAPGNLIPNPKDEPPEGVRGPDTRKTLEDLRAKFVRVEIGDGGRKNVGNWVKKNLGFDPSAEQADRIWAEATQPGGRSASQTLHTFSTWYTRTKS